MPRYIYPGPYARTPIDANVPPAWSPPAPEGVVVYPEPLPPGGRFITTELDLAWPGGRNALGVPLRRAVRGYTPQEDSLVRYAGTKDRTMWGSHFPEPQPVAFMGELPKDITIYKGSRSLAADVDMDDDDDVSDLDDEGLMQDLAFFERRRGGSRNARGSRALRDAILMETLGVSQDDIDFVEQYGADEPAAEGEGEAEAKKRPFERTRTFFTEKVPSMVDDFRDKAKRAERKAGRIAKRATAVRRLSEDMAVRSDATMALASKQLDAQQARAAREAEEQAALDAQRAELEAQRSSPPSPGIVASATSAVQGLSTPAKIGIGVAALAAVGAAVYFVNRRT